jgi:hypothetical protein
MKIEKAFSLAFIVGVLALQFWVIFPPEPRSKDWYWPFVNYPMYSQAKSPGEVFREHAIEVRFAEPGSALRLVQSGIGQLDSSHDGVVIIGYDDLKIRRFAYYRSLDRISGWASGRSGWDNDHIREELRLLELNLSEHLFPGDSLVLLEREFPVGRRGLEDRDPPWREVHAWAPLAATESTLAERWDPR